MQRRTAALVVAAASLVLPGSALAAQKRGTVVKVDRPARLVAVAGASGHVALVHATAAQKFRLGQRVAFSARKLRNGSFAGSRVRVLGVARRAHVRGVVLARSSRSFALSAHGAVLRIHARAGVRHPAGAGESGPPVGSSVDVSVELGENGLTADKVDVLDRTANAGVIEGKLTAIGPGAVTISDEGVALTLSVGGGIDLSQFKVGDEVFAYFARQSDGSFALTAISGDENATEADDEDEIEGNVTLGDDEAQASEDDNGSGDSSVSEQDD